MDLSQSFGSGFFGFSVVLALRVLVFYLGFGPSGLWIWLRVWVLGFGLWARVWGLGFWDLAYGFGLRPFGFCVAFCG